MTLQSEAGPTIQDPSDDEIAGVIAALNGDDNPAAQLMGEDESFLQAAWGPDDDWLLEWHDDANDEHLEAADPSISRDDVTAAFRAHASGDSSWREQFTWEAMDL
jgi:hypothetical protein